MSQRNFLLGIVKTAIALPLVYLLWVLSAEFIKMYGFVVLPIGAAVYLVIFLIVDRFFSKQSESLESLLDRKLNAVSEKFGFMQKHR